MQRTAHRYVWGAGVCGKIRTGCATWRIPVFPEMGAAGYLKWGAAREAKPEASSPNLCSSSLLLPESPRPSPTAPRPHRPLASPLSRFPPRRCYREFCRRIVVNFVIMLRAKDAALPFIKVMHMNSVPILQLLRLEEKLLRTSSDNWFIVNEGTINPTIVMGISGKPSELIEIRPVLRDGIPVIKRFTGGGTVIVDHETIFASIICNKDSVPGLQPYPRPIMSWTEQLYGEVFNGFGDFRLRENDYVFDTRKFGGNAQSIVKNRWIHHTSFLWDYDVKNMGYLKLPKRAPEYRSARDHVEFLCRMKEYLPSKSTFSEKTIASLGNHFRVQNEPAELLLDSLNTSYSSSTKLLTKQELITAHFGLMK